MPNHNEDEYLDLVDEDDNVIGKKKRSEVSSENLSNFRVVNVFIKNSKGEIWIPRRTANKRIFPLCLDMSMGGHVESGESYEEALKREAEEELNLNIEDVNINFLTHLTPAKDDVSAYMKVYEILTDQTPIYNKEDFIEYFWLKPSDLKEKIKNGDKAKDDLLKLIDIFYSESGRKDWNSG